MVTVENVSCLEPRWNCAFENILMETVPPATDPKCRRNFPLSLKHRVFLPQLKEC